MGSRPYNKIPPDAGGGCVKEGPFAKYYRPRFLASFLLSLSFILTHVQRDCVSDAFSIIIIN